MDRQLLCFSTSLLPASLVAEKLPTRMGDVSPKLSRGDDAWEAQSGPVNEAGKPIRQHRRPLKNPADRRRKQHRYGILRYSCCDEGLFRLRLNVPFRSLTMWTFKDESSGLAAGYPACQGNTQYQPSVYYRAGCTALQGTAISIPV